MKKIIFLLAVLFTASATVAQNAKGGAKTPEQRAQRSVDNLDKNVTLTAEQKPQVYNLALARAQKVDEIRAKYKGQPEQKETAKSEIRAAHKEYALAVKPLLTAEQINQLKAKRKAAKGNAKKGGKGNRNNSVAEEEVEELIPAEE